MAGKQKNKDGLKNLEKFLGERFSLSHNDLPEVAWQFGSGGFMHLEFMMHGFGCWAILSNRMSGQETGRINLGTYNDTKKIENLVRALQMGE